MLRYNIIKICLYFKYFLDQKDKDERNQLIFIYISNNSSQKNKYERNQLFIYISNNSSQKYKYERNQLIFIYISIISSEK